MNITLLQLLRMARRIKFSVRVTSCMIAAPRLCETSLHPALQELV